MCLLCLRYARGRKTPVSFPQENEIGMSVSIKSYLAPTINSSYELFIIFSCQKNEKMEWKLTLFAIRQDTQRFC